MKLCTLEVDTLMEVDNTQIENILEVSKGMTLEDLTKVTTDGLEDPELISQVEAVRNMLIDQIKFTGTQGTGKQYPLTDTYKEG